MDSYRMVKKGISGIEGNDSDHDNVHVPLKDDNSLKLSKKGKGHKSLMPSKDYLMRKRMSRDDYIRSSIIGVSIGGGSASGRHSVRSRKSISPSSSRGA